MLKIVRMPTKSRSVLKCNEYGHITPKCTRLQQPEAPTSVININDASDKFISIEVRRCLNRHGQ